MGQELAQATATTESANSWLLPSVTATKATVHRPDPEILTIWQETVEVPCVAIGGITAANAGGLARAGADFVAVSAAVWGHPEGPAAAVRALERALAPNA